MGRSRLVNRNVIAGRGRTSMRLEPELWDALREICLREGLDVGELVRRVEAEGHAGGRTSAVRVFVVQYFRTAAHAREDDEPEAADAMPLPRLRGGIDCEAA